MIAWWPFKWRRTPGVAPLADAFRQEMARNLQRVQVMEQRQIVSRKMDLATTVPPEFERYAQAVRAFNAAFDEHQRFQAEYASSMDHKTRANALILDRKYETMMAAFNALKPQIILAQHMPVYPAGKR